MGFFSWLTADTNESIPSFYSARPTKVTYLLRPEGAPIKEENYDGYGHWGGKDVYGWLALDNFGDESLSRLAIHLDCGKTLEDSAGNLYLFEDVAIEFKQVFGDEHSIEIFENWNETHIIDGVKSTINEHFSEGRLIKTDRFALRYPLKFSCNPNALYNELPASRSCPDQGFFYEDDLDDCA